MVRGLPGLAERHPHDIPGHAGVGFAPEGFPLAPAHAAVLIEYRLERGSAGRRVRLDLRHALFDLTDLLNKLVGLRVQVRDTGFRVQRLFAFDPLKHLGAMGVSRLVLTAVDQLSQLVRFAGFVDVPDFRQIRRLDSRCALAHTALYCL
jgi:hypothetical protein